eukprot:s2122_g10.t1
MRRQLRDVLMLFGVLISGRTKSHQDSESPLGGHPSTSRCSTYKIHAVTSMGVSESQCCLPDFGVQPSGRL